MGLVTIGAALGDAAPAWQVPPPMGPPGAPQYLPPAPVGPPARLRPGGLAVLGLFALLALGVAASRSASGWES